jgi:hypothetical protein
MSLNTTLLQDHEYQLTITKEDKRIVLNVYFIKYAEPATKESIDEYIAIYKNLPLEASHNYFTNDNAPYSFLDRDITNTYGLFRIMSIVSFENISADTISTEFNVNDISLPIHIHSDITTSNTLREEKNKIGWYFYPGTLIWILLSPTDQVSVTEIPRYPSNNSTDESFQITYPDYIGFKEFIDEYVSQISPVEYRNYLSCLSPSYFTTISPTEYSFLNIPSNSPETLTYERPFYAAMLYIFSIMPHYSPSIVSESPEKLSEHSYFIYLNRLIYYYNIYLNILTDTLKGFENSAVLVINLHGGYYTFDYVHNLPSNGLKNVFICTKSAPGIYAYDSKCDTENKVYARRGNLYDKMFDSINQYKALSFDEISIHAYKLNTFEVAANCRVLNKRMGTSMEHYISPRTNAYIEKEYRTIMAPNESFPTDGSDSIIDIKVFGSLSTNDAQERLNNSNILLNSDFIRFINAQRDSNIIVRDNRLIRAKILLSSIIEFYNTHGVENIFIYDTSCGAEIYGTDYSGIMNSTKFGSFWFKDYVLGQLNDKMNRVTKNLALIGFGGIKKKKIKNVKNKSKRKQKTSKLKKSSTRKRTR